MQCQWLVGHVECTPAEDQMRIAAAAAHTHLLLLDKVQIEHRQLLQFDHVFHLQHLHRLDLDEFMGTQRLATPLALLDARRERTKAPAWNDIRTREATTSVAVHNHHQISGSEEAIGNRSK